MGNEARMGCAVNVTDLLYGRPAIAVPSAEELLAEHREARERFMERHRAIARAAAAKERVCSALAGRRSIAVSLTVLGYALALFIALCLTPGFAHADIIGDIFNAFTGWIKEILGGAIDSLLDMMVTLATDTNQVGILTASWSNLFGGGSSNFANLMGAICNSVVKPVAASVLVFVCLIQLVKISSKIDSSSANFGAVKEIIILFITLALFMWAIQHSDELCIAVYDVFNQMTIQVQNLIGVGNAEAPDFHVSDSLDSYEIGDLVGLLIGALLGFLVSAIAYMIVIVMSYARAIQLYIFMAFSPLPLSFLGIDETRSFGVGYIKNFMAVALAGVIMYVILVAYPYIMSSVAGFDAAGQLPMFVLLKVVGVSLLLALAIFKSGAWARDILGS